MALQEEMEKQGIWLFKYRGTIPLIILVIGAVLLVLKEIYPETYFLQNSSLEIYYEMFCLFVSLIGLGIRVYTVGHTPVNTSGRNTAEQIADTLNTTGIYSIVRHPLYLGNFFMWAGPALLTGNLWFVVSFCFFYWIYYERIMFAEEQFLRRKFGDIYDKWSETVASFIPFSFRYIPSKLTFSVKNVLKREYNSFVNIFVIFTLMDLCRNYFLSERIYLSEMWIYISASAFLIWIVVRTIHKRTTWLEVEGR